MLKSVDMVVYQALERIFGSARVRGLINDSAYQNDRIESAEYEYSTSMLQRYLDENYARDEAKKAEYTAKFLKYHSNEVSDAEKAMRTSKVVIDEDFCTPVFDDMIAQANYDTTDVPDPAEYVHVRGHKCPRQKITWLNEEKRYKSELAGGYLLYVRDLPFF